MSKPTISLDFGDDDDDIFDSPKVRKVLAPTFKKKTVKSSSRRVKRTFDEEDEAETDLANEMKNEEKRVNDDDTNKTKQPGGLRMMSKFQSFTIEQKQDRLAKLKKYEALQSEQNESDREGAEEGVKEDADPENTPIVVDLDEIPQTSSKNTAFTTFEQFKPLIDREASTNLIPEIEERYFRDQEPKITLENEYGDDNEDNIVVKGNDLEDDQVMDIDELEETKNRQFAVNDEIYDLEITSESETSDIGTDAAPPLVVRSVHDMLVHITLSIDSLKLAAAETEAELGDVNQQLQVIETSKQQLLKRLDS